MVHEPLKFPKYGSYDVGWQRQHRFLLLKWQNNEDNDADTAEVLYRHWVGRD